MRIASVLTAVCVLGLVGCNSKVKFEKADELSSGTTAKFFTVDGPDREQKIRIEVSAAENVCVYVILEKDAPSGDDFESAKLKNVLASKKDSKDASLDVTVPAKEKFRVIVGDAKKSTSFRIKINSI